jgi:hypothetical protein
MKTAETKKVPTASKCNNKDSHFAGQMSLVFHSFSERPKTMRMVEIETGIMRCNICRYVSKWKKSDRIKIAKIGICPITKNSRVQFLTTKFESVEGLQND